MPIFRTATVRSLIGERPGLQRFEVMMADGSPARAYGLTELIGTCEAGDRVVLNTTAVERDLGTGGWHFVHWNLSNDELVAPGPEHIMKIRYTSLQADVGTAELDDDRCDEPITGVPVVVCSVHSQIAAVAAAFARSAPGRRLGYVMTDGASLPIAMSDLVDTLVKREFLAGTVTAGHAFGGELEAVTVHSALGLAVHSLGADAVVVGMGPGVVGTGTELGTTGIEVAPILDAVRSAGGVPIMCVRASSGDPRPRHRGISHHSVTAARLTNAAPLVATVPSSAADLPGVTAIPWREPDPQVILGDAGIQVTTMGRSVVEDPDFFAAACAAGELAAAVVEGDLPMQTSRSAEPDRPERSVTGTDSRPEVNR